MRCPDCGGMMCYTRFYNFADESGEGFRGWRCIHCGLILDKVILKNRKSQQKRAAKQPGSRHQEKK